MGFTKLLTGLQYVLPQHPVAKDNIEHSHYEKSGNWQIHTMELHYIQ